ncbi:MAG: GAF domain-containing protein [Candidatus Methanoperedens sp.]|nr:GAF domain-containing protein [Candidatus Methanoperedens sp.]MCZ7396789.1 GAF domain-containing protein [Candidatus Methanoperedens sp.]
MKNLSIRYKLIIFLIAISILPYAVISYINYSTEKDTLEKKVFEDLSGLVEAKSTHISTVVNFRIEQVKEVATANFLQQLENRNTGDINLNLLRVKREIPEFFEISALDVNGIVLASTESGLLNKNYSEEEFFKKGKEALYLGNINYYDNNTGYILSYPVFNRSTGRFIGVIAATVYPMFIYDVTNDYTALGESGEALLVQKRGNEVVFLNPLRHNPDAALRMKFPMDSNLAIPAILAAEGKNGTIQAFDYRGKEVFAAYSYIPAGDWGLVVKMDASEALMPVTRFEERSIALGMFYFAVVVVLAYMLGRRFTAPLVRLTDASKKVAKGYLTVEIEPESRDEIGELAGSFNIMVQKLREVYEGLEQKVKERTKDLNRRNLELAALIKTNQSISSGLDLNKVLGIAVREAVRIVNVSYCSIALVEGGKDYGTVASEYSPGNQLKPSQGEILYLKDFPSLSEAYTRKQYVLVPDTKKADLSPKEKEMADRLNIRSILVMPLIIGEKTLGTMQLSSLGEVKEFTVEEIGVCQTIANQAAIAIENAHLYSELQYHDKTLETLFEIDRVVSQSLDLDEIFKEALAKTIQVTSSDAGAIYLLEETEKKLKFKTSIGLSETFVRAVSEIKLGEGIAGTAAQNKKPFVTDIDHFPTRELLPYLEKEGLITLVGTPLIAKGKVVGAMNLANRRRRVFSKDDIDVLASIGSQIGVAIENARLYQEARVSYEKLQSAYDELKSLDRMKSEFLSNVSHELKTPLVSIRGYSELMYDEKLGTIPETQKKALEAIIRNTDRLTRLIDSLLFLSIQQMGKPEIKMKPKPQLIDEIITASMADMNVLAGKKNISIIKDVPSNLAAMGDRDRLTEVFLNLMDNAIKFTPVGGKITIKAWEEKNSVHTSVTDTGVGIPKSVLPFLFQRFYQADASLARKYGGTGLGLYICKSIVDAHKGEIWIESEVGKGATVHVLLPRIKS